MKFRVRTVFVGVALTAVVILLLNTASAQKPLAVTTRPFEPVEELFFEAEFSRALLRGINVAEFKFRSSRTPVATDAFNQKDPKYNLTLSADVYSKGFFTRLFNLKFREQVESVVEPSSFTIQKTTILDEQGKRVRHTETIYNREKGLMEWTLRDPNNPQNEPRKTTTEFSGQLQDVLSVIYFIRTQPLQVGKSFEVFVGDGGRIYKVPVHVVQKKKVKTLVGKVNLLRLEPELFGPDRLIDDEKGEFTLWVTDDARHIPISAKIKTDYGNFDVKLKRITNNPS